MNLILSKYEIAALLAFASADDVRPGMRNVFCVPIGPLGVHLYATDGHAAIRYEVECEDAPDEPVTISGSMLRALDAVITDWPKARVVSSTEGKWRDLTISASSASDFEPNCIHDSFVGWEEAAGAGAEVPGFRVQPKYLARWEKVLRASEGESRRWAPRIRPTGGPEDALWIDCYPWVGVAMPFRS